MSRSARASSGARPSPWPPSASPPAVDPTAARAPDKFVDGKTFTLALAADPGALDPQMSAGRARSSRSPSSPTTTSSASTPRARSARLARSWKVDGTTVTLDPRTRRHLRGRFEVHRADGGRQHQPTSATRRTRARSSACSCPAGATAKATRQHRDGDPRPPAPFVLQRLREPADGLRRGHEGPRGAQGRHRRHRPVHAHGGRARTTTTPTRSARTTPGARTARRPPTKGMPATIRGQDRARTRRRRPTCCSPATLNAAPIIGPDARRVSRRPSSTARRRPALARRAVVQPRGRPRHRRPGRADGADPGARPGPAAEGAHLQPWWPGDQLAVVAAGRLHLRPVEGNVPGTDVAAAKAALDAAGWVKGADGMRAKGGKPLALTFLYDTRSAPAAAARPSSRSTRGRSSASRSRPSSSTRPAWSTRCSAPATGTSPGSRSTSTRPSRRVPFFSGPGVPRRRQQLLLHQQRRLRRGVQKAMGEGRRRRLPRLAGRRGRAVQGRRRGPVRQQRGAVLRQGRRVRGPRQHRARPASGCSADQRTDREHGDTDTGSRSAPAPDPEAAGPAGREVDTVRAPSYGAAAGVAVGAGHRVVPDDPPGARATRSGRRSG